MMKNNWAAIEEAMYDVVVRESLFLKRDIRLPAVQKQGMVPKAQGTSEALSKWESVWHVQKTEKSQYCLSLLSEREVGKRYVWGIGKT